MEPTSPFRNTLTMTCPVCHVGLQPTSRQGIEIDFCPQCRGIWLDRGELDKILDRESAALGRAPNEREWDRSAPGYRRDDDDDDRREGYGRHKKRRGLLGELFDFD